MRAKADLFRNPLDTYSALAVYYASKPSPSYTIKQAARCFWSMALQFEGEIASHKALADAGIALPDFLRDVPPSGELVKRQKREREQRRATMKAAA
jgi:hypothetical protein